MPGEPWLASQAMLADQSQLICCVSRQRFRGAICTKCFRTWYMLSWCIHGPDQVAGIRFLVPLTTSQFWMLLTRSHRWSESDTVRWACHLTPVFVLCTSNRIMPTPRRKEPLPRSPSDKSCDRKAKSCLCVIFDANRLRLTTQRRATQKDFHGRTPPNNETSSLHLQINPPGVYR